MKQKMPHTPSVMGELLVTITDRGLKDHAFGCKIEISGKKGTNPCKLLVVTLYRKPILSFMPTYPLSLIDL